ncbi:Rib/alpha-like domain-containing protein [Lactobacillus sp. PV012]|uniref:Rib/alpha-like domain-containing protein n=1 Tax=Lactobacillus sp. PV012 TaxID=2594494 RepID=UPI00223F6916|nr:Rib/alpha-like domain-containing protein [Lactobacillus sp. PV012]QNQ81663.1 YSIRK-type signal peptide-containing protein [Lactobacillus sp. PV012]
MLSKKNYKERLRKMEAKKERFSIRKFSVGAASVLIGFFLTGIGSQQAHAATTDNAPATEKVAANANKDENVASSAAVKSEAPASSAASSATTEKASSAASSASSSVASAAVKSEATSSSAVKSEAPASSAAVKSDAKVATSNASSSAAESEELKSLAAKGAVIGKNAQGTYAMLDTTQPADPDAPVYKNSQDVQDWAGFISALSDANVDHINITKDITVTGQVNGTAIHRSALGLEQKVLYAGSQDLDGKDIARKVTISGNNNTIDFTNQNLNLVDKNQGDNHAAWDMTFEDVTIKADELKAAKSQTDYSSYSPISLTRVSADKQALDTITFKNVTAEVNGRPVITGMTTNSAAAANTGYEKYTLVLKGNNNLTSKAYTGGATPGDDGDAISAGYIGVEDGTTTVNMPQTSSYNLQYGGAAVRANGDYVKDKATGQFTKSPLDVKEGATLNIKGGKDVKGIVALGTGAQLVGGSVNIDGNVNMDLADGHSIAVYSGNLITGKTGNLDITTKMSAYEGGLGHLAMANFNGTQFGVLSIGTGIPGAAAIITSDNRIEDNGSIKIVRNTTDKGANPMITMGTGASSGNTTLRIDVNEGATLDLQDHEQQTALGMIFMPGWIGGPAGENLAGYVNFNNPEYVNLQRLNPTLPEIGGSFIFNQRQKQQDTITNTPVAQWNRANLSDNPDYTWMITNSQSRGRVSMSADGFAPIGFNPQALAPIQKAASSYLTSNGSVVMGATQGAGQYNGSQKANENTNQGTITAGANSQYLNSFLNNFSWWTPQRIAMGSKLLEKDSPVKSSDKDLYDPEVQTIDGTTQQSLKNLDPNKGIKDLLEAKVTTDENGKQVMGSTPVANWQDLVSSVTWYDSAKDAAEWDKEMVDAEGKPEAQPQNPTGQLKTTDKSAWAKVTYKDGSVDFVNIPLNITAPYGNVYQPSYKDTTVTIGKSVQVPVTITKDGKTVDAAPEGTKYAIDQTYLNDIPAGIKVEVNNTTGKLSVETTPDAKPINLEIPVVVSYPDGSADTTTAKVNVVPSDANEYQPSYKPVNVKQGESVETGVPTYTDADGKTAKAPKGTTYKIPEGTKLPEGVTAKVDPNTGNVTVTTSSNTPAGPVFVPVTVTYPDGSSETVDAPIAVGPNTFIGTDYTVTVTQSLKNLHETTANSMYPDPMSTVDSIIWWNNNDVRNGKDVAGHKITNYSDVKAEWIIPINTNVDKASMEAPLPGVTELSADASKNPSIKLTFGQNSELIKETGTNLFATPEHSLTLSGGWYGPAIEMQGAAPVADAASKKAELAPAKAGDKLTDAELALINTTNLDKLTANKPVSYTWANDLKAGDTKGTVRITFQDKDKNGQPTYLDVELPAGSLNVVNPKTDADKYTPQGQDVHTKVGGHPEASQGIANIPSLPTGTKYTWKDGEPDTKTPGTKPATVVVTYPDGSKDEVPVKVIVDQPGKTYSENATGTPIVTPKGVMPNPSQGIGNKGDLDPDTKYTWTNGEPDVNKIGKTTVSITVTYPDGKTQVVDTPLIVTGTEKPGDPGITNPDDPAYSDLFKTVTRTIVTETTNSDGSKTEATSVQKVVFGRSKTVDNQGNTTYSGYTIYDTTTNKLTNDKTGTFTKVVVPQHDGYVSQVNGVESKEVPEVTGVTAETPNSTVTITYVKAGSDAAKYTPEGQPVNTKQGVVPPAEDGIKNKTDLPTGTKYSWKKTPDVTTSGSHPAVVVVTYPDGSQDEVPVTVNVPAPEGQNINTPQGVVPNPEQGIKNPQDMPEGTKYTWKDTPDVNTIGEHPAVVVVTYPDGKTEEVPVTVTVTTPSTPVVTPTDADQYTPQGQDVPTVIGTVPNAADGIKNKTELPGGTTYTWKDTPDVNTPGSHDATIIVTYPDGSQDEVPVKVVVTAPEGQDIHTPQGVVPNPEDGIKNRTDLPSGTKYTWKDTPDVSTPGNHPAVVIVTLPNGKTVEVPVTVTVDNPTPEGQDIHTPQGVLPNPSEGIKNKDDMPSGTKYEWEKKPDVKTPGKHEGTIRVIFPNGETVDVPVTVVVAPKSDRDDIAGVHGQGNENGDNNGNSNGSEVVAGVKGTHEGISTGNNGNGNTNGNNSGKSYMDSRSKTLPQTGANDGAAAMLGLMIASVGAILGLAVEKKRRN